MNIYPIKKLNQFIPSQFLSPEYRTIIKKKNGKPKVLELDYLSDLFHSFYIKFLRYKNVSNYSVITLNLSSEILRKKYGLYYQEYVNLLMNNDFISLKSNYINGQRCNKYRLSISTMSKHEIIPYENKNKNLIKFYNSPNEVEKDIYPQRLRNYIKKNLNHLSLDFKGSMEVLENEIPDKTSIKYRKNLHSIQDIQDGNIYTEFDKYGRIHTNYTVLKKTIRKDYLLINNQKTYERDIPNSQPLFFLLFLSENLSSTIDRIELLRFKTYITRGIFYDDLCNFSEKNRNDIKVNFFKYLFGVVNEKFPEFQQLYPSISRYLKEYKISVKDYRKVSHKLQELEGDFVFNGVCEELRRRKVIFYTVHDSICVSEKNKVILDDIFNKELSELKQKIDDNISGFYSSIIAA
jgi:hypothetical protein